MFVWCVLQGAPLFVPAGHLSLQDGRGDSGFRKSKRFLKNHKRRLKNLKRRFGFLKSYCGANNILLLQKCPF